MSVEQQLLEPALSSVSRESKKSAARSQQAFEYVRRSRCALMVIPGRAVNFTRSTPASTTFWIELRGYLQRSKPSTLTRRLPALSSVWQKQSLRSHWTQLHQSASDGQPTHLHPPPVVASLQDRPALPRQSESALHLVVGGLPGPGSPTRPLWISSSAAWRWLSRNLTKRQARWLMGHRQRPRSRRWRRQSRNGQKRQSK